MNHPEHEFMMLFRGRGDGYGTWEGGRAQNITTKEPLQLTPNDFVVHLNSPSPAYWIGVYPHLGAAMDQSVTWGCIDIDGKDFQKQFEHEDGIDFEHDWDRMWALATKLRKVLAVKQIWAHIEKTRNGYHLWVFPETGLAPAKHMRRALMAACKAVGYNPKEVNPKSEELAPGKLGNYVRLPYYGHLSTRVGQPDRYFVNDNGEDLDLGTFLACVRRTGEPALEETAKLWTPPEQVRLDGPPPEDVAAVLAVIGGLAHTIWKDGPLEGRDRSNTLTKLAFTLRDDDISMPSAFAVVKDADRRWGKFFDRPDCDAQILNIVEHAYSN